MSKALPNRRRIDRSVVVDLALAAITAGCLAVVMSLVFRPGGNPSVIDDRPRVGTLAFYDNEVRRRLDGTLVWDEVGADAVLYVRDAVYVAEDSAATIALDNGGRLDIDARSLVILHSVDTDRAPKAGPGLAFEIVHGGASGEAGTGTLAMRAGSTDITIGNGSAARIEVGEDMGTAVTVARGTAKIGSERGPVELHSGQRQTADASGQLQAVQELPIRLVEPADRARTYAGGETIEVSFAWAPLDRGKGPYRFELAKDTGARGDVRVIETEAARTTVDSLAPGTWVWRVSRAATTGAPRLLSEERRLTIIRDLAPTPYRPYASSTVDLSSDQVVLGWTELPSEGSYVVELYPPPAGGVEPIAVETVHRPTWVVPSSILRSEGNYCYRVRAASRSEARWSERSCFRVVFEPVLPAPVTYPTPGDPHPGDGGGSSGQRGDLLFHGLGTSSHAAASSEAAQEHSLPLRRDSGGSLSAALWWLLGSVAHADPVPEIPLLWEALPGAVAYEIEIDDDDRFGSPFIAVRVTEPRFAFSPPVRRRYYWRVRAIDAHGRRGLNSDPRVIDVTIPTPVATGPVDGAWATIESEPPSVRLRWKAAERSAGYILEIARSADFTRGLESHAVAETSFVFRPGTPGSYWWRVFSHDASGARSEPTAGRLLEIRMTAPRLAAPASGARIEHGARGGAAPGTLTFEWSALPVRGYELQLARNAEMEGDVIGREVRDARTELELGDASAALWGDVYWRVRGLGPDTAWSEVRRLDLPPPAPVVTSPNHGARLAAPHGHQSVRVALRWEAAPGATTYEVTLTPQRGSTARQGAQPLERVVEATETELEVPAGAWRWQVTARAGERVSSAPSTERELVVTAESSDTDEAGDGGPGAGSSTGYYGTRASLAAEGTVHVAPRLGMATNFGGFTSPLVGVSVGYRPAFLDGSVRVVLAGSYYPVNPSAAHGAVAAEIELHAVPLDLVAYLRLPLEAFGGFDWFEVEVGLGGNVTVLNGAVSVTGEPERRAVSDTVAAALMAVAVDRRIGIGDLFVEAAYAVGTRTTGPIEHGADGLTLVAGYRFYVF